MVEDSLFLDDILKILPHRYPFLLIDKVIKRVRHKNLTDWKDAYLIARKNVTFNEPFFKGHFPGNPIMPGVLQIEAMAQAAALLMLKPNSSKPPMITGIEKAKFRAPVIPGNVLEIYAKVLKVRSNICVFEANIIKEDKTKVSEAQLTAHL